MDLTKKMRLLTGSLESDEAEDNLVGFSSDKYIDITDKEVDYEVELNPNPLSIDSYLKSTGYKKSGKKKKKKKNSYSIFDEMDLSQSSKNYKSKDEKMINRLNENAKKLIDSSKLLEADEFDAFLDDDSIFSAEENIEMRNNLISMGRKYARESAETKENSEINKTFADSDKRLKALFDEVSRDKESLQKDIDRLRVPGRGGKNLSDMISAKNNMHTTQLQIIKEINQMKKSMYDLKAKEAAKKEAENAMGNDINSNTLQSIFSSAKTSLINNVGGYSSVSGSSDDDDDDHYTYDVASDEMDDEEIQKRYFNNKDLSSDGDKFLEYEDRGVEYVLVVDDNDKMQRIFAEDRDGNIIPDYPLPNNVESLSFEIDPIAKTAVDSLHRTYKLRRD